MDRNGWKFCFIGGLTVQAWSEPRYTRDADLTLLTGFGGEEAFIDELLAHYTPRRPDAKEFALLHRVLLLQDARGLGIDIELGALPFEAEAVARARLVEAFPGVKLRFCTAEDLIVMKAFASREQDWIDVRMTIARQGTKALDWDYINAHVQPLVELKGEPEIMVRVRELRRRSKSRNSGVSAMAELASAELHPAALARYSALKSPARVLNAVSCVPRRFTARAAAPACAAALPSRSRRLLEVHRAGTLAMGFVRAEPLRVCRGNARGPAQGELSPGCRRSPGPGATLRARG